MIAHQRNDQLVSRVASALSQLALTLTRFTASMRSLWHTMTTNDRHASYNSPYRTGQHVPLGQSRHSPLTSVATDAHDSRTDLDQDSQAYPRTAGLDYKSPTSSITPDGRSFQRQNSMPDTSYHANGMASPPGDVPMQSFEQGLPPPPPVTHSWKRIGRWLEDNYEELGENVCEGCSQNDMNELEHELDCTLPQDVRESWQAHDGQERGGRPTGVVFGCMLLDCEEIVQEWHQWRRTNEEYLTQTPTAGPYSATSNQSQSHSKEYGAGPAASSSAKPQSPQSATNTDWRGTLLSRQDSQPPNTIQKAYVHPGWIPLVRDWGGNNICVDLAPGPNGVWGQVILMGRDYDCKYVIARSWAAFLANIADDMSTDKWFIDEETKELKLREFPNQPTIEPAYLDILRWRADQKSGSRPRPNNGQQRPPKRQTLKINSAVKDQYASLNGFSPYATSAPPIKSAGDRMRSPPRTHGKSPANMPSGSSPLARVTEEQASNVASPQRVESPAPFSAHAEKTETIDSPVIGSHDDEEEVKLIGNETMSSGIDGDPSGMRAIPL